MSSAFLNDIFVISACRAKIFICVINNQITVLLCCNNFIVVFSLLDVFCNFFISIVCWNILSSLFSNVKTKIVDVSVFLHAILWNFNQKRFISHQSFVFIFHKDKYLLFIFCLKSSKCNKNYFPFEQFCFRNQRRTERSACPLHQAKLIPWALSLQF